MKLKFLRRFTRRASLTVSICYVLCTTFFLFLFPYLNGILITTIIYAFFEFSFCYCVIRFQLWWGTRGIIQFPSLDYGHWRALLTNDVKIKFGCEQRKRGKEVWNRESTKQIAWNAEENTQINFNYLTFKNHLTLAWFHLTLSRSRMIEVKLWI